MDDKEYVTIDNKTLKGLFEYKYPRKLEAKARLQGINVFYHESG